MAGIEKCVHKSKVGRAYRMSIRPSPPTTIRAPQPVAVDLRATESIAKAIF
jgi:hypothetical protein